MHLTTIAAAAALFFAAGSNAWAQAADGTWIANDTMYTINGVRVHESCTIKDTNFIRWDGDCEYWIDGNGNKHRGQCYYDANGFGLICLGKDWGHKQTKLRS